MTVKAFSWEAPFAASVAALRRQEAAHILRGQTIKGVNLAIFFAAPALTSLATFVVYWALDNPLEVGTIYSVMSLLNALRLALGKKFTRAMESGPEAMVTVGRLQSFLETPELADAQGAVDAAAAAAVSMRGAAFRWEAPPAGEGQPTDGKAAKADATKGSKDDGAKAVAAAPTVSGFQISNISFEVHPGEVLLVLGPVGCGKSTLLSAILGEVPLAGGKFALGHGPSQAKAYSAQQPWIKAGTLRDNIVFGNGFDEARYKRVLACCALEEDVAALPVGDATEIGEKGVNLSGGQKARVALARATYSQPCLALLDDPLGAVDAAVAQTLFTACIRDELAGRGGAAVVLATHQKQFVDAADRVLLLNADGSLRGMGTAAEMRQQGFLEELAVSVDDITTEVVAASTTGEDTKEGTGTGNKEHTLVVPEDREIGVVSKSTYAAYVANGGVGTFIAVGILMVAGQGTMMAADAWLNTWAKASDQADSSYVVTYLVLGLATVAIAVVRAMLFFRAALRSSSKMHDAAFDAITHAPMSFFSANPLGRVVNKFSSDQGQVDESLPATLFDTVQIASICVGSVVMVCIAIPWVALALLPLAFIFVRVRSFYISSGRELKRLEGMGKSPVYTLFHASLNGLLTIRAFGRAAATHDAFLASLETYGEAWYWCASLTSARAGLR
jgi:ATP-binding cassette subfamily C (CFTR/MRP) protein 4